MLRTFLMMAMLWAVTAAVRSLDESEKCSCPAPEDFSAKECACTCVCLVNASSLPQLPCPAWPMLSSTPAPTPPVSGFAILPNALYKYFGCESADKWSNANATCGKDKAYLAVPETTSEIYLLLGMLIFHPHPLNRTCSVFIGLHANSLDRKFRTVHGGLMPKVIADLWDGRGDSEIPDENRCLTVDREGKIQAEDCEEEHAYACKMDVD